MKMPTLLGTTGTPVEGCFNGLYDFGAQRWSPILCSSETKHGMDGVSYFTLPSFPQLHETAEARMGFPDVNGRIIGFFKLKSNLTILVESLALGSSSSQYPAASIQVTPIAARKLAKKEAVKLRDATKKLQVFEQSFHCGTGQKKSRQHVCNFVGFQLSSLMLSVRGIISLSGPLSASIGLFEEDFSFQQNIVSVEPELEALHEIQQAIPVHTAIEGDECYPCSSDSQQGTDLKHGPVIDGGSGSSDAVVERGGPMFTIPAVGAGRITPPMPLCSINPAAPEFSGTS